MDRSDFLKKMVAGAAIPGIMAGCSADDETDSSILDSGSDDSAAKAASVEDIDSDQYDFTLTRQSWSYFVFKKIGTSGSTVAYAGSLIERKYKFEASALYDKKKDILSLLYFYGGSKTYMYSLKKTGNQWVGKYVKHDSPKGSAVFGSDNHYYTLKGKLT